MAYILSIATHCPDYRFEQKAIAESMIKGLGLSSEQAESLNTLYSNSEIDTRHSVIQNFDTLYKNPTSKQRNEIYKEEAPKLAVKVAQKALNSWGGNLNEITHVISISCTGMMAPGIEYHLIKQLELRPTVGRIGINFMGCFAAFNGISVAKALAKENPKNRILLVCTELCSLNGQMDLSSNSFLANALFADGAAACIIGGEPSENYLWQIIERSSNIIPNSDQEMTWDVGNNGYFMKLSSKVPVFVKNHIATFTQSLVQNNCSLEECLWAIHPGGKSIIKAIEKACNLLPSQSVCSWEVLKNYGNMSSATFLFVLQHSLTMQKKWTLGIGLGPGLSIEGVLLRSKDASH
ncbi:MAG: type III polyketide synthase [Rhabdochlamydiaceae bacterium]|nr:type III polyketide synthase [Rhabdochlamydiaceae bacterium]